MRGRGDGFTGSPRRPTVRGVHEVGVPSSPDYGSRSGWIELAILFLLSAALAAIIVATSAPANARPGSTHAAVLTSGETTSLSCAEGVAKVGSATWVNDNEALDRLHLPMRGRLHVVNDANAVFTAHGIEVKLAPAMPCTPG
jgi:hypothetical protein